MPPVTYREWRHNVRQVQKKHFSSLSLRERLRVARKSAIFWGFVFADAYREQDQYGAARLVSLRTLLWIPERDKSKTLLYYIMPDRFRGMLRDWGCGDNPLAIGHPLHAQPAGGLPRAGVVGSLRADASGGTVGTRRHR